MEFTNTFGHNDTFCLVNQQEDHPMLCGITPYYTAPTVPSNLRWVHCSPYRSEMPKRTNCASLRGGLLRLTMAGFIYVVIGPTNFWLGFVITEIIAYISSSRKEGLLMVKKAVYEVMAYATKRIISHVIVSWERHLPSGHSPLMSL